MNTKKRRGHSTARENGHGVDMLGCVVWVVVLVVVVWVVVVVVSRARAVMVAVRIYGGGSATADTTPPDGEGERGVMVSLT